MLRGEGEEVEEEEEEEEEEKEEDEERESTLIEQQAVQVITLEVYTPNMRLYVSKWE